MKKISLLIGILCSILTATAQNNESGINIGYEASLPIGDFANTHKFGNGFSILKAFGISDRSAITLHASYMNFFNKEEVLSAAPIKMIPIRAGYRYYFEGGFYLEPKLGYSFNNSAEENEGNLIISPSIGIIPNGKFDLTLSYQNTKFKSNNISFLTLRLAYTF